MAVISAGICTKDGNLLLSRQFTQMTRMQVEDLYLSFPKLLVKGQQHTYVESEKHLFVYSLLSSLFLVLVCHRGSNIIEHMQTLRLLYRAFNAVCKDVIDNEAVDSNCVDLLLAIDDVLCDGHRESITFSELQAQLLMESAEEKKHIAILKQQEEEAKIAVEKAMKR